MLLTIVGDDFEKKSKKTKEILASLKIKKPDAIFSHYDSLDLDKKIFKELIQTIKGQKSRKVYKLGDKVEAKVLSVDIEKRKIELTLK